MFRILILSIASFAQLLWVEGVNSLTAAFSVAEIATLKTSIAVIQPIVDLTCSMIECEFNFKRQNSIELLAHLSEPVFHFPVAQTSIPFKWVKPDDLSMLVMLLDSDQACGRIRGSYYERKADHEERSTVGREAARLISLYRFEDIDGRFDPAGDFVRESRAIRQWYVKSVERRVATGKWPWPQERL